MAVISILIKLFYYWCRNYGYLTRVAVIFRPFDRPKSRLIVPNRYLLKPSLVGIPCRYDCRTVTERSTTY